MPFNPFDELDLTDEFRTWAKVHAVTPIILHRKTGWSYGYCHSLLRGPYRFGYRSFGMIVCAFGLEALRYIIDLAPEKLKELQPGE